MNLLFVGNQNEHRSKTAEAIFKDKYNVKSAGIYPTAETVLTEQALEWADVVFVMGAKQLKFISDEFPGQYWKKKIVTLDIPDNIYNFMDRKLIEVLKTRIRTIYPKTGNLKAAEGFADKSIVKYIDRINRAGYTTCSSCSGVRADHDPKISARWESPCGQLVLRIPENRCGKNGTPDPKYVKEMIELGNGAGWEAEEDTYLRTFPTIYYCSPSEKPCTDPDILEFWEKLTKALEARQRGV